jgi:carboxylesterase
MRERRGSLAQAGTRRANRVPPRRMTSSPLRNEELALPGRGDAILLAHGLSGGVHEVQWLAEHLHRSLGATVVARWMPGHAPGSGAMPACGGEDWAAAVAEELGRLEATHPRAHLVGFSTGCLAVLRVAELRPLSGRLALLAPFMEIYRPAWLPVRPERLLAALPGLRRLPNRAPPLADPSVRRAVARARPFGAFNLDAARQVAAFRETVVLPALEAVRAPTLILQGRRDSVVLPAGARRLAALLGERAQLLELERSDHLLGLDVEREAVFAAVTRHLAASSTTGERRAP